MEHAQTQMLLAAILTTSIAAQKGANEPAEVVRLLAEVHKEIVTQDVFPKVSATFIPKGR